MKEKDEPSFPAPFEGLNQEMTADIQQLRHNRMMYESAKKSFEIANAEFTKLSSHHAGYDDKLVIAQTEKARMKNLEKDVQLYEAKTYGRVDRLIQELDIEPPFAQQMKRVLDELVNPENFENKAPAEEKAMSNDDISVNQGQEMEVKAALFADNQNQILEKPTHDNQPDVRNYNLSLLQQKQSQRQLQMADAKVAYNTTEPSQPQPMDKGGVPHAGYLNYQLKNGQAPKKDNSDKEKQLDFLINKHDISPDKD